MKKSLFVLISLFLLPSCSKKLSSDLINQDRASFRARDSSAFVSSSDSSLPFSSEFIRNQSQGEYLYTFNCFDFKKTREEVRRMISPDEGKSVFFIGYDSSYTLLSEGTSNKEKREVKAIGIHFSSTVEITSCRARRKTKDVTFYFTCSRSK